MDRDDGPLEDRLPEDSSLLQRDRVCVCAVTTTAKHAADLLTCRISRASPSMSTGVGSKISLEVMPIASVTLSEGHGPKEHGRSAAMRCVLKGE
jgi:hypothetical protein